MPRLSRNEPQQKFTEEDIFKIVDDLFKEIETTNDLWELDKVLTSEMFLHDLITSNTIEKINSLSREWSNKRWGLCSKKKLMLGPVDVFNRLYEDYKEDRYGYSYSHKSYHTQFTEHLNSLGLDSQECFVSYEFGYSGNPEYNRYYWDGFFRMGFDVWDHQEENPQSGFAIFTFQMGEYGEHQIKEFIRSDYPKLDKQIEKDYRPSDQCIFQLHLGEGTFYSHKTARPYKDLIDYCTEGGFALRLD